GDAIITRQAIAEKVQSFSGCTALIVHTHPYPGTRPRSYSGTNPPYFHPEALKMLRDEGIEHLLTDLPSVDKENDGGLLPAHRTFWNLPEAPLYDRFITELISVPEGTPEGRYLLDLQLAPISNDAAPSRPLIHPLVG
ncbi:MAG: cyclase family protein, partial [Flavobacteriales bacterium]